MGVHQLTQSVLARPFRIGQLELRNRVVMAPMTRSFSPAHVPGEDVAAYYRRRAQGGVGLLITEGTYTGHEASGDCTHVPSLSGEVALAGWRRVVEGVHAAGGRIASQLWHIGLRAPSRTNRDPDVVLVGPSGLGVDGKPVREAMSEDAIASVIAHYGRAAANAKAVGFDAVELHAGHGYLIDQFFWERTNKRTDRYGGDLVARTRFACEVIAAVRKAVGPGFPISFRYSQWKIPEYTVKLVETPQELERFLTPLVQAGVDIFHCSTRRYWEPEFAESDMNLAGWTKKLTGKTTITVGSVGLNKEFTEREGVAQPSNIDRLEEMMARGDFDLVAVGRALLADPNWLQKVLSGDLAQVIPFHVDLQKTLA
jgi:2,4-dienoyl-CoA reductase-like NADH-dependent reductase (Old Yellow Enzyme family)